YPRLNGDLVPTSYRLSPDEVVAIEASDGEEETSCAAQEQAEPLSPPDARLFRCGCGTTAVHINAWGQLSTCTWVTERVNLRESTVADAIAEVFPRIRAAWYQTDTPCRTCQVYTLCDKMPANAAAEAGNAERPVEHFCRVAYRRAEKLGLQEHCPVGLREEEVNR